MLFFHWSASSILIALVLLLKKDESLVVEGQPRARLNCYCRAMSGLFRMIIL